MNGLDNAINDGEAKQVSYDDSGGNYTYKQSHAIDEPPLSFQTKEHTPDFVSRAEGFIGKRTRNAF